MSLLSLISNSFFCDALVVAMHATTNLLQNFRIFVNLLTISFNIFIAKTVIMINQFQKTGLLPQRLVTSF